MKEDTLVTTLVKSFFYIVLIVLFSINIAQLNNIEKRMIEIGGRLQKIEDKNNDMANTIKKLQESGPAERPGPGTDNGKKPPAAAKSRWLHPEVKNFLSDDIYKVRLPETKEGGTLTRWFPVDPKSLNSIVSNDGEVNNYIGYYVNSENFGNRSWADPNRWVKMLAERIEITDDYKEYTIYLRKGVKWHRPAVDWANPRYNWLKGDHYVTAKDVKFTIDIIRNPQVESPFLRSYYEDLEYVKVVDDYTVIFRWKKKTYNSLAFTVGLGPIPEFLYAFDEDGTPFPKETLGLKFNSHWYNNRAIGCGPYEFVSYETGVSIKLRRFEDFYDQKPAIQNITYLIYPDQKQNLLKLKSKIQDFGIFYPIDYREEILNMKPDSPFKKGTMKYGLFDEMTYTYLGWNNENPLFADKRVRRAMTHSLNCKYMLHNIFMDLGNQLSGPLNINSPSYDKSLKPLDFSLDKARKLLTQAGWKDIDNDGILEKKVGKDMKKFEFSLLLGQGSPEWDAAMNIYKEDLLKIGVKMNLRLVDWAVMTKKLEDRDFDAYGGAWGMPWEQDPYQIWHSSQAAVPKSSNHISFRNKEADKVIDELRSTFEPDKRNALYHKFHRIIYDEQPYTFFFSRKRCGVWWNHLHRVIFTVLRPNTYSVPWYIEENAATP
jgi:peptide/nickel transport system substrate-binding protein